MCAKRNLTSSGGCGTWWDIAQPGFGHDKTECANEGPVYGLDPDTARTARGNLVDIVHAGLFDAITSGDYPALSRLPTETELARQYGVSRSTVREALSRLRLDGLIASRRGIGSYVLQPQDDKQPNSVVPVASRDDMRDCFAFRIALESAAAGLAAEARSTTDLANMRRSLDNMDRARTGKPNVDEDHAFHVAIARASRNAFILTALDMIACQMRVSIRLSWELPAENPRKQREQAREEHRQIFAAIARGSASDAAEAMRRHLRDVSHLV